MNIPQLRIYCLIRFGHIHIRPVNQKIESDKNFVRPMQIILVVTATLNAQWPSV